MQQPHPPLSLSDSELECLTRLAAPLELAMRDPFLRAVAHELGHYRPDEIGAGTVHRVARSLQREFYVAPAPGNFKIGKYR